MALFLAILLLVNMSHAGEASEPAETGDAFAQYRLAQAYIRGAGVPKDARKAYDLMTKAAEQGYPDAIGGIGYFYSMGFIVKKDVTVAAEWFKKGAEKGGPRSQVNYARALIGGRGVPLDEAEGLKWLDKALVQDVPEAHFMKGDFYYRGEYGHPQDYVKAREYLEKAAAAGHAPAENMLGTIYEQGLGVPVDLDLAIHWFRKAAEQGDPKGMSNLGQHLGPDGPDASKHVEALMWLLLAARANEPMARQILGEIIRSRPPEVVKQAQARVAQFKPRIQENSGHKKE